MGVHFSVFYIVKSLFSLFNCFSVIMSFGLVSMFLSLGLATAGLAYVLIFLCLESVTRSLDLSLIFLDMMLV